jgi:Domain of unknown function DUF1828./Domain of unknown function DUF1829.
MNNEIEKLLDESYKWLKNNTTLKEIGPNDKWIRITTPYLDRHNDYIMFYIRKEKDDFILSDAGNTIKDLEMSGCLFNTKRRTDILNKTISCLGIKINDNKELYVQTSKEMFAVNKLNFLQAIISVNDLYYLSSTNVQSFFQEDVELWLHDNNIRTFKDFKLTGKSGFNHPFDFAIPESDKNPERLLKTISSPNKSIVLDTIFSWDDTKENRNENSELYVIINDKEKTFDPSLKSAFSNYGINSVAWSDRENLIPVLNY